jgi:hypothetical protein
VGLAFSHSHSRLLTSPVVGVPLKRKLSIGYFQRKSLLSWEKEASFISSRDGQHSDNDSFVSVGSAVAVGGDESLTDSFIAPGPATLDGGTTDRDVAAIVVAAAMMTTAGLGGGDDTPATLDTPLLGTAAGRIRTVGADKQRCIMIHRAGVGADNSQDKPKAPPSVASVFKKKEKALSRSQSDSSDKSVGPTENRKAAVSRSQSLPKGGKAARRTSLIDMMRGVGITRLMDAMQDVMEEAEDETEGASTSKAGAKRQKRASLELYRGGMAGPARIWKVVRNDEENRAEDQLEQGTDYGAI